MRAGTALMSYACVAIPGAVVDVVGLVTFFVFVGTVADSVLVVPFVIFFVIVLVDAFVIFWIAFV